MAEVSEVWEDLISYVKERSPDYDLYYNYWDGQQSLPVNSQKYRSRFGDFFSRFRDNMARPIIETAESRVRVLEFGDGKDDAAEAQKVWRRNRMTEESKWVHKEAMVKGDAYVIVLPDEEGNAGIYPQISQACAILYSEVNPREKVAAIKWWVDWLQVTGANRPQEYVRVNIYYEDRIERYVTTQQTNTLVDDLTKYREYDDEGDWVTGHDLGQVPMFQFSPNYEISEGRGRSDLADATGLIDGINKTFLDMLISSEFTAAPQRWATGVEIPLDPQTGEPLETYRSGADKLWTAPNEAAKFGQFTPGDLNSYKVAIDLQVEHLAFTTRTPTYALAKAVQYPSGEMLKSAEGPLRQRVKDHQDAFGVVWLEVMRAALSLEDVSLEDDDFTTVLPRWLAANAPFETTEHLEEIKIKVEVAGIPEEMAWRELGYTADEIEEMKAMRQEEAELGGIGALDFQAGAIAQGAQSADTLEGGLVDDANLEDDSVLAQP